MENARSKIDNALPAERQPTNSLPSVGQHSDSLPTVGRVGEGSGTAALIDPVILAVCASLLAVYLVLGAKALNLDGLGYAGRVESDDAAQLLLPGHLLYGPLMHALYRLANAFYSGVDAARLMQVSDAVFGAVGVGVFISALRRLAVGGFTAMAAGIALGLTYTYWTHATDLTTYALSTLCLILAFHSLCAAHVRAKPPHVWAVGALVALATLIHQSNLVFLPAAMVGAAGAPKPWRNAIGVAVVAVALVFSAYAVLGWVATGSYSPSAVAKWAAGGAHGYAPSFEPVNLVRGVYGFANAIMYLDDAGTAIKGSAAGVAGSTLPGPVLVRFAGKVGLVGLMLAVPFAAYAKRRSLTADQAWAVWLCVVWIVPYVLVALVFFTTDHDRWIMLMPAVAALAAVAHPKPTLNGRLAAAGIAAALFGLNLTSAIYPAHTGAGNRCYQEARRLAPRLDPADLVLFWGHYHIGTAGYLRRMTRVEAVHIVDLVLKNGRRKGLEDLAEMVSSALVSNRRVLIIGLYGSHDTADDYLAEAHALSLTRADIEHALSGFTARPIVRLEGCAIYQMSSARRSLRLPVPEPPGHEPIGHGRIGIARTLADEHCFDSLNQAPGSSAISAASRAYSVCTRSVHISLCSFSQRRWNRPRDYGSIDTPKGVQRDCSAPTRQPVRWRA